MKKITTIITVIATIVVMMMFTSCDSQIAYDLEGVWQGDMYMIRDGRNSIYTELEFYTSPYHSTSGSGYWYEEYSRARGDYFYSRMEWKVRDKKIYIYLLDDRDRYGNAFELIISDYHLDDDRFWGYVDYEGGSREFNLYHTASPHWNDYEYDYYYSKGSRSSSNDSIKVHTHQMRMD